VALNLDAEFGVYGNRQVLSEVETETTEMKGQPKVVSSFSAYYII
jgi:hypothetical protein